VSIVFDNVIDSRTDSRAEKRGNCVAPTPEPVVTASARGRVAALTFDDGPNGEATSALLDLLAAHGVRATFCVVGAQVRAVGGAELLRRTVAEGHHLAAHGMTFADQGAWHPDRARADLRATVAVIRDALGDPEASVPWFRAPNGSWGGTAAVAVDLGLQPLGVTGTIDDWRTQHVGTLVANLRAAIRPGGIVLAHDGGGDRRGTVAALRTVLPHWLDAGWRFTRPAHPDLDAADDA
jgi:endo-1,4-beta-xylanase